MSQYDDDNAPHEGELQLVTFRIGDEEFGVDILLVQEIIRMLQITMVPRAPFFIEGVINLRGKVIPVVNMRTRFNKPAVEHDANTRIVVMELEQKSAGFPGSGPSPWRGGSACLGRMAAATSCDNTSAKAGGIFFTPKGNSRPKRIWLLPTAFLFEMFLSLTWLGRWACGTRRCTSRASTTRPVAPPDPRVSGLP